MKQSIFRYNMKTALFTLPMLIILGCNSNQHSTETSPLSLPVIEISAQQVTTYQEFPASVKGVDDVEIRPQVSGVLQEIFVDEGAFVNAGQSLFRIDEQPFKAVLNNAEASLHAAEGVLANATLEEEKMTPLVANKVVSDYQLKTAKAAVDIAKAHVEEAKANISTAKINLGYTLIKAPISGFIGRLDRKKGSIISPADANPLTNLSDVHNVHVYFSISEKDFIIFKAKYPGETLMDKIKSLPPVSLQLGDNSFYSEKGNVDMVDGQFDANIGAITMRATFPNKNGLLRSGNTGKIQLGLNNKNIIAIPAYATIELQDKVFVYVLTDSNKVKRNAVLVIGKSNGNLLINEGLKAGDRIVVDGLGTLQDGTVIQPKLITAALEREK